ncbi:MAG: hypothetical protein D3919_03630 [Candidatus Electrothrix sp. AW5]|nr:hypothetical protein [Candidatus Electrothrix gigas]
MKPELKFIGKVHSDIHSTNDAPKFHTAKAVARRTFSKSWPLPTTRTIWHGIWISIQQLRKDKKYSGFIIC